MELQYHQHRVDWENTSVLKQEHGYWKRRGTMISQVTGLWVTVQRKQLQQLTKLQPEKYIIADRHTLLHMYVLITECLTSLLLNIRHKMRIVSLLVITFVRWATGKLVQRVILILQSDVHVDNLAVAVLTTASCLVLASRADPKRYTV